jgi:hypothetical protein
MQAGHLDWPAQLPEVHIELQMVAVQVDATDFVFPLFLKQTPTPFSP